jgi:hypothetical protein
LFEETRDCHNALFAKIVRNPLGGKSGGAFTGSGLPAFYYF